MFQRTLLHRSCSPASSLSRRSALTATLLAAVVGLPTTVHAATAADAALSAQRRQVIEGFGGSIANYVDPASYDIDETARILTRDLGISIFRAQLDPQALVDPTVRQATLKPDGSTEWFAAPELYTTPVELSGSLSADVAKFDMQAWRVGILGEFAQAFETHKLDEFRTIGSIWSPPAWMKGAEVSSFDGSPTGNDVVINSDNIAGGSLIDTADNYRQFGAYVSAYAQAFEQEFGVGLAAISLQNEPRFRQGYHSTLYDSTRYVEALTAIDAALRANGQDIQLFGPETVGVGDETPDGLNIQDDAWRYIDAILQREQELGRELIDFFAVHGYDRTGASTGDASAARWNQWRDGREGPVLYREADGREAGVWPGYQALGRTAWMTEQSGQSENWLDEVITGDNGEVVAVRQGAIQVAVDIHTALVEGDISAYLWWTLDQGPLTGVAAERPVDGISTFALLADEQPGGAKYSAFKHFSRYIRPGAQRLELDGSDVDLGLFLSAFLHDEDETLTLVLINDDAEDKQLTLDLSTLEDAYLAQALRLFQSDLTQRFADGGLVGPDGDGVLSILLPAFSVSTLVSDAAVSNDGIPEPAGLWLLASAALLLRRRHRPAGA